MRVGIRSVVVVASAAVFVAVVVSGLALAGVRPGVGSSLRAEAFEGCPTPTLPVASPLPTSRPSATAIPFVADATAPSATFPGPPPLPHAVTEAPPAKAGATIALVPVVGFWSAERSVTRARLAAIVAGTDRTFRRVLVAAPRPGPPCHGYRRSTGLDRQHRLPRGDPRGGPRFDRHHRDRPCRRRASVRARARGGRSQPVRERPRSHDR